MKIFILYDKSGIHSGRSLGQYLIKKLTPKVQVHRGRPKRLNQMLNAGHRYDYIVNVGWYKDFETKGAAVLNSPSGISISSNKKKARLLFAKLGVPAPKLWTSPSGVRQLDLPAIARTTHHTKGHGLWYCTSLLQVNKAFRAGATHLLKFVPNTREFRVHVMAETPNIGEATEDNYRVIKLSEKVPHPKGTKGDIVKNHDNGWFFGYPEDKKDPALSSLRGIAKKAVAELNLHWGAVDIMVSRDTGEPFVLEINSTPCLTDDSSNTLEKYATSLTYLMGIQKRVEEKPKKKAAVKEATYNYNSPSPKKKVLNSFFKKVNL